jgi:hypothetical protein
MIRRATVTVFILVLAALPLRADEWTGWITDEHCGAKGAGAEHKSCALKCVENGASLVLDLGGKKLYKLTDQNAAKEHLGQEVKVVGTLERDTITVESMETVKHD